MKKPKRNLPDLINPRLFKGSCSRTYLPLMQATSIFLKKSKRDSGLKAPSDVKIKKHSESETYLTRTESISMLLRALLELVCWYIHHLLYFCLMSIQWIYNSSHDLKLWLLQYNNCKHCHAKKMQYYFITQLWFF